MFINDGVYRVADKKRRDGSEQWSKDMVDAITGTPSEPVPEHGSEMKAYTQKKHGSDAIPAEVPSFVPNPDAHREARKMKILRTDIMEHGATDGCPGCRATLAGERSRNHTDACRKRFSDAGKERVERAMSRMTKAIVEESERLMKAAVESVKPPPNPEQPQPSAQQGAASSSAEPSTPKPTATNRTNAMHTPMINDAQVGGGGKTRQASSPAFNANAGVWAKVEFEEDIPRKEEILWIPERTSPRKQRRATW